MNILTQENIKELVEKEKGICASIYLPTFRTGQNIDQNKIAFKNLLRKTEKELKEAGIRKNQMESFLEQPNRLLNDSAFWKNQSDGLAVFISEDGFSYHRFPLRFEPLAVTGNRFHLKPLLPMLSNDGRFYLLTLNLNGPHLYQGTHYSVSELKLQQVPDSLREALKYDDPERQIQYHSGVTSPGGRANYKPTFHGQGVTGDEDKNEIVRFFQKVDKGIKALLGGENSPLVLAGMDHLIPLYRKVNSYPHLLEDGVVGNPEDKDLQELHRQGWKVVKPIFEEKQEKAREAYLALSGRNEGKSSADLKEVVPAAHYGKVDILFVPVEKHVWGTFDPEAGEIDLHDNKTASSDDLIDLAAVQTLFHGGRVFAVEAEKMPAGEEYTAAVFRF